MEELKQVCDYESTETMINIDYCAKTLKIYTTKATVMNRMARMGYEYSKQEMDAGQVFSRTYEFGTKDIGKFLRTGIFKFD